MHRSNSVTDQELVNQLYRESKEKERPFFLLRPKLFKTYTGWKVVYGANDQTGLVGFGSSPNKAALDFDEKYFKDKEPRE